MPAKRKIPESKSKRVFGQSRKLAEMLRAGLYARVSTLDQQTLPMPVSYTHLTLPTSDLV